MSGDSLLRVAVDRGGTFTDVVAFYPNGELVVHKLLSEDPGSYDDAPTEGIRRALETFLGEPVPRDKPIPTKHIKWIRMGTTVATNALLERTGAREVLVISKGFRDLLRIGNQQRPRIFDLEIKRPELLYDEVIEIDARVRVLTENAPEKKNEDSAVATGVTGESVEIIHTVDEAAVREALVNAYKRGAQSVAVCLLHSYTYAEHEQLVGSIAKSVGFAHVSLSSDLMPRVRAVPRGHTACVDAYLTPPIRTYIQNFAKGFDDITNTQVQFMQSDGGLTPVDGFHGFRAVLSGPAGGAVGIARCCYDRLETKMPVIGFDMGGTSTDVSRYDGDFEHVFETEIAGVSIQAPQIDISTVAAGGGSRLFYRSGLLVVGPESAGAHPGPACYRKGGPPAVTDANAVLGRILPAHFPKIFGPQCDEALDVEASRATLRNLADTVGISVEEAALGFIRVANEAMCRPIRAITEGKGYSPSSHCLCVFGGAGGQHACAIARDLGITKVYIPSNSGVLSAEGIGRAERVCDEQQPCAERLGDEVLPDLRARLADLARQVHATLAGERFSDSDIALESFAALRYDGTDTQIMIAILDTDTTAQLILDRFEDRNRREFGFVLEGRSVVVDAVRVRGVGHTSTPESQTPSTNATAAGAPRDAAERTTVHFDSGACDTPVLAFCALEPGRRVCGPAIIMQNASTIVVEPGCTAWRNRHGDVEIDVEAAAVATTTGAATGAAADSGDAAVSTGEPPRADHGRVTGGEAGEHVDPILLSIFSHRFMGIAEQMGRTLQRTSISVNIKERLDFSCALFGADGGLVSNAPHLPVHLGAMQSAVKWQIEHLGDQWREGDVVLSNHPQAGGSHLPDITVMTPVFHDGKPIFFVANRGHHQDIGGISPGSMPPFSKRLSQEGACIHSMKIVENGEFMEQRIRAWLASPQTAPTLPGDPPSSGSRAVEDNISDLKAQIAANQRGISLVRALIVSEGLEMVDRYMRHIQHNAEVAVRDMMKELAHRVEPEGGSVRVVAEDRMDDGSRIHLVLSIDRNSGSATFDFSGVSPEVYGNTNAPLAVTKSAILYCLRCMLGRDIPLNQGCMEPIALIVPENSLLRPSGGAAVVGGNVLTSQRVTDVVLQGCMNNLTFGDERMGYYETICGGAGAGPTWHGQSGVHTHMTNTRITDPETLERRYPVLLREFSIRENSGGVGHFRGGDGIVREIEVLRPLHFGILSERRVFAPRGAEGGGDGQPGLNLLLRRGCSWPVNLGGKATVLLERGDAIRIETPGGGGWGQPSSSEAPVQDVR